MLSAKPGTSASHHLFYLCLDHKNYICMYFVSTQKKPSNNQGTMLMLSMSTTETMGISHGKQDLLKLAIDHMSYLLGYIMMYPSE